MNRLIFRMVEQFVLPRLVLSVSLGTRCLLWKGPGVDATELDRLSSATLCADPAANPVRVFLVGELDCGGSRNDVGVRYRAGTVAR